MKKLANPEATSESGQQDSGAGRKAGPRQAVGGLLALRPIMGAPRCAFPAPPRSSPLLPAPPRPISHCNRGTGRRDAPPVAHAKHPATKVLPDISPSIMPATGSSAGTPPQPTGPPRMLVIGAGSRGRAYARAVRSSTSGVVAAVAEPDEYKRNRFGETMIWGTQAPPEGASFVGWREFIAYETSRRARVMAGEEAVPPGIDAVFVCVLDEMHREVVVALASLGGLHIMCEKPLATTLQDCIEMYNALQSNQAPSGQQAVFSIGHVLRYSPHNTLLRKLVVQDRVIGDTLSVVHTEPVGWWHFAHSYVRGNWYVALYYIPPRRSPRSQVTGLGEAPFLPSPPNQTPLPLPHVLWSNSIS